MKLILNINDKDVLLTPEQLEAISDIFAECEYVKREYKKNPDSGEYYYESTLDRIETDVMKVTVMPESRYNELKFFTAAKTAG